MRTPFLFRTPRPARREALLCTDHLVQLTGPFGLFEHAKLDRPRVAHGYTIDDNARALVVLCRLPSFPWGATNLFRRYLSLVTRARTYEGWHNRLGPDGRWRDRVGPDDCHGRAIWGLGVAAAHAPSGDWRIAACEELEQAPLLVSPHPRANAYAVLGATAALTLADPPLNAESILMTCAETLPSPRPGPWMWPEPRLTYANARIPQAMIAAGRILGLGDLVADGLELLDWLVGIELSAEGHFSFTPVGGRGPVFAKPAFDQQPIEAWAMADACREAASVTGEQLWEERWRTACAWFLGANDNGVSLYDPATGAGFDGLTSTGVNLNRGAESTLAALGSLAWLEREGD